MSKHTPGPWKVISEQTAREVEVFEVAEVAHFRVTPDRSGDTFAVSGDAYADARLIASSPDLLAAAKLALSIIGFGKEHDAISAAIARATEE